MVVLGELRVKMFILISKILISQPYLMFDHLLESSVDDSNKWSNIGFGEVIT